MKLFTLLPMPSSDEVDSILHLILESKTVTPDQVQLLCAKYIRKCYAISRRFNDVDAAPQAYLYLVEACMRIPELYRSEDGPLRNFVYNCVEGHLRVWWRERDAVHIASSTKAQLNGDSTTVLAPSIPVDTTDPGFEIVDLRDSFDQITESEFDANVISLRCLGYNDEECGEKLNVHRSTVRNCRLELEKRYRAVS